MKRFMSIVLLAAASLVAPALAAPADTPQAAFERYRTQINQHDFDRLAREVIAIDAVFVFTDKVHRGIDAARREFNATWSTLPDEVYTMSEPEWLSLDADSALVAFRYGYRGTLANGKPLQGGGRGTNLFVRTPAGWRLKYEHLSHDPAPPAKKA
ncbi:MAG: nuclear transport factor 2 family protein [Rhodanobacteraceae bacterium]|jgi:ketosteroid isomerase-like protein|nr:nuclear transport factor 2 family protein [Rhodanobacteraceae bacterium]